MLQVAKDNKKLVLKVVWSVVGISWLVLGGLFFMAETKTTAVIALTVAAVITEIAVWLSALLLGLAMVDARKALWQRLTAKPRLQR